MSYANKVFCQLEIMMDICLSNILVSMKTNRLAFGIFFSLLMIGAVSCNVGKDEERETLDLSGEWGHATDPENVGITQNWQTNSFQQIIDLPGTTAVSTEEKGLSPQLLQDGAVWYTRKIDIPEHWKDKHIELILERTNHSMIWIDGSFASQSQLLFSPQHHDLSQRLSPGVHTLTLRISNGRLVRPFGFSQNMTEKQPLWNGVLGSIKLEASSTTHITSLQVTPNLESSTIRVKIRTANPPQKSFLLIRLAPEYLLGRLKVKTMPKTYRVKADSLITLSYQIKGRMPLWDEFKQPMLRINLRVSDEKATWMDFKSMEISLRKFSFNGTYYTINGNNTFLRGIDASGEVLRNETVSMDEEYWSNYFKQVKIWGINHIRFNSWCPPEAAFDAADKSGLFIQVDLSSSGTPSPVTDRLLQEEGKAILSAYGHHPSFVLMSAPDMPRKELSPYKQSSPAPQPEIELVEYAVYPVEKQSGNEKPVQDKHRASVMLAALCYRANMETAFKTPGLVGYHLPPLHFKTENQVTSFGFDVIDPSLWRQVNNDVVPLLSLNKYCWNQSERFVADVHVVNFSNKSLYSAVRWKLYQENGSVVKSGSVSQSMLKNGQLSKPGQVQFSLAKFDKPIRLNLEVYLDSTDYKNSYPIWVYPLSKPKTSKKVYVSSLLNKAVMNQLEAGGKVLLLPTIRSIYTNSLPGSFTPDLRQSSTTSPGTLGLFINSKHPIFKHFPTEYHTNWQWLDIITTSRALNLSTLDSTYTPIVQVIDRKERNLKLGMIAEFKVGAGKLLICTSKLFEIMDKPEVVHLYNSLLEYMESEKFNPSYSLSQEGLKQLVTYTVTTIR